MLLGVSQQMRTLWCGRELIQMSRICTLTLSGQSAPVEVSTALLAEHPQLTHGGGNAQKPPPSPLLGGPFGGQLFLLTFFLIRLRCGLPKLLSVLFALIGVCVAQEGALRGFWLGVTLDGLEWPYRGC